MIVDTVVDVMVPPHLREIDLLHQGGDTEGIDKCAVFIFSHILARPYYKNEGGSPPST